MKSPEVYEFLGTEIILSKQQVSKTALRAHVLGNLTFTPFEVFNPGRAMKMPLAESREVGQHRPATADRPEKKQMARGPRRERLVHTQMRSTLLKPVLPPSLH